MVNLFWSQCVNPVLLHQWFTKHFSSIWCSKSKVSSDRANCFRWNAKWNSLCSLATIWYGSYRDAMGVEYYKKPTIGSLFTFSFGFSRRNCEINVLQWNCWIFPPFWLALLESMRKQSISTKSFEFKWSNWSINIIIRKWTDITHWRTRRNVTPSKRTLWTNFVKWHMKQNINSESVPKQWNQPPNEENKIARWGLERCIESCHMTHMIWVIWYDIWYVTYQTLLIMVAPKISFSSTKISTILSCLVVHVSDSFVLFQSIKVLSFYCSTSVNWTLLFTKNKLL